MINRKQWPILRGRYFPCLQYIAYCVTKTYGIHYLEKLTRVYLYHRNMIYIAEKITILWISRIHIYNYQNL